MGRARLEFPIETATVANRGESRTAKRLHYAGADGLRHGRKRKWVTCDSRWFSSVPHANLHCDCISARKFGRGNNSGPHCGTPVGLKG